MTVKASMPNVDIQAYDDDDRRPLIVGIGGTLRPNSSTERVLRAALRSAEQAGANTCILTAEALDLPMYGTASAAHADAKHRFVDTIRRADGLVIASPGYHGSLSGLVKNALDYIEDLRTDERPYLHGRAVGCIAVAGGWQAAVSTLTAVRSVVHALRGWPTPFGAAINSTQFTIDAHGKASDPAIEGQINLIGQQVVEFSSAHARRH